MSNRQQQTAGAAAASTSFPAKQQPQTIAANSSVNNTNNNNRRLVSFSYAVGEWKYLSSVIDDVESIKNDAKKSSGSARGGGVTRSGWGSQELRSYFVTSNSNINSNIIILNSSNNNNNNNNISNNHPSAASSGSSSSASPSSSAAIAGKPGSTYKVLALFEGNFDDQGRRDGWGTLRVFRPHGSGASPASPSSATTTTATALAAPSAATAATTCISIACRWVADVPQIEWDPCRLVEELLRTPQQINSIVQGAGAGAAAGEAGEQRPACEIYNDCGRRLISVYNGLMLAISQDFTSDRFAYGLQWALSTQFLPHTLGEKHDLLVLNAANSSSYVPAPQGGVKYCGQWQMGERHGFGMERQISSGGLIYAGPYEGGVRHGVGLLFHHQSKTCLDATWNRGKIADCPGALHIQGFPINVLGRWSGDSTVSQGRLCRSNGASGLWEMLFAEFDEQMATLQEEVEAMLAARVASQTQSPDTSSPVLSFVNGAGGGCDGALGGIVSPFVAPSSTLALPASLILSPNHEQQVAVTTATSASPHNDQRQRELGVASSSEQQIQFTSDLRVRILHAKDEIASVCEPIGCVLATPQLRSLLAVFQRCFLFSYGSCSPSGDDVGGGIMTAMDMAAATPPCLAEDEERAGSGAPAPASVSTPHDNGRKGDKADEYDEATDDVFLAPKSCMSWCGLAVRDMCQRNIFPPEFAGLSQQSHLLCIHRQRNATRDSEVELFTRAIEDVVALVISVRLRLMNLANSTIIGNGGQGLLSPSSTFSAEAIVHGVSANVFATPVQQHRLHEDKKNNNSNDPSRPRVMACGNLLSNSLLGDPFYDFSASGATTEPASDASSSSSTRGELFNNAFADPMIQSLSLAGTPLTPSARAAVCSWDAVLDVALPPLLKHAANVCKEDNAKFVMASRRMLIHSNYPSSSSSPSTSAKATSSATNEMEIRALELLSSLLPQQIVHDASHCVRDQSSSSNDDNNNHDNSNNSSSSDHLNKFASSSFSNNLRSALQSAIERYAQRLIEATRVFANMFTAPSSSSSSSSTGGTTASTLSQTTVACASESTQSGLLFGCFRHAATKRPDDAAAATATNTKRLRSNKAHRLKKVGVEGAISSLISAVTSCGIQVREASSEFAEIVCNAYLQYHHNHHHHHHHFHASQQQQQQQHDEMLLRRRELIHDLLSTTAHPRRILYQCGFRFVVCFAASMTSTPKSMLPQLILLDTICEAEAPEKPFVRSTANSTRQHATQRPLSSSASSSPASTNNNISAHDHTQQQHHHHRHHLQAIDEMCCALLGIWRSNGGGVNGDFDDDESDDGRQNRRNNGTIPTGHEKNSSSNYNNNNSNSSSGGEGPEILAAAAVALATGAVFPVTLLAQWCIRSLRGAIIDVTSLANTPSPISTCKYDDSEMDAIRKRRPCCCFCRFGPGAGAASSCFCSCTFAPALFTCDVKARVEDVMRDFAKPSDVNPSLADGDSIGSSIAAASLTCAPSANAASSPRGEEGNSRHHLDVVAVCPSAWFLEYRRTFRRPLQIVEAGSHQQNHQDSSSLHRHHHSHDGSSSVVDSSLFLTSSHQTAMGGSDVAYSSAFGTSSRSDGGPADHHHQHHQHQKRETIADIPFSNVVDKALTLLKAASKNVVVSTSLLNQLQQSAAAVSAGGETKSTSRGGSPVATLASARGLTSPSLGAGGGGGAGGGAPSSLASAAAAAAAAASSSQIITIPLTSDAHEKELLRRIGKLSSVLKELSIKTEVQVKKENLVVAASSSSGDDDDDDDDDGGGKRRRGEANNNNNNNKHDDHQHNHYRHRVHDGDDVFAEFDDNSARSGDQKGSSARTNSDSSKDNTNNGASNTTKPALTAEHVVASAAFAVSSSSSDDDDQAEHTNNKSNNTNFRRTKPKGSTSAPPLGAAKQQTPQPLPLAAATSPENPPPKKNVFLDTSSGSSSSSSSSSSDDDEDNGTNITKTTTKEPKQSKRQQQQHQHQQQHQSPNIEPESRASSVASASRTTQTTKEPQPETTSTAAAVAAAPVTSPRGGASVGFAVNSARSVTGTVRSFAARTNITNAGSATGGSARLRLLSTIQPATGIVAEKKLTVKFSSASHFDNEKLSGFLAMMGSSSSPAEPANNRTDLGENDEQEDHSSLDRRLHHRRRQQQKKTRKIEKWRHQQHLQQEQTVDEDAAESVLEYWIGRRQMFVRPHQHQYHHQPQQQHQKNKSTSPNRR